MSEATAAPAWLEPTRPGDRYADYCLWDYQPLAPTAGKLRSANLLWSSFEAAGAGARIVQLTRAIQAAVGPMNVVWGVKQAGGRIGWEYYFYDYARMERTVSISRILAALRGFAECALSYPENRPYFMFSIDIDRALAEGLRPLDEINIYVGNPGSSVSSGLCYSFTDAGLRLDNLYFFFDAVRDRSDIVAKIAASAHLDLPRRGLADILWPELVDCKTIVVANKKDRESVYFSRIRIDQLIVFLERLCYPAEIVDFARTNRGRLDHLLYDVGFDYVVRDGRIEIVKSGYYGLV